MLIKQIKNEAKTCIEVNRVETKESLEIILITYNRKKHLQNTFDQIFAENSPIKDFQIKILDNKSTDGSMELIKEYANKYPNIQHIRHNRNIGGNGNIARAFEIASKKYVWVLCDDDEFDWTNWSDVERAINEDYDLIVVSNYLNPAKNTPQLLIQLTFVPAGIYKTDYITDTVMINANFNICNMFPHFAVFSKFINDNKQIYICKDWIVNMCNNSGYSSYTRGLDDDKHVHLKNMFWQIGFLNSVQLIKDKKLRTNIIDNMHFEDKNLIHIFREIFIINNVNFNNSLKNLCDVYCAINFRQKLIFILFIPFILFPPFIFYIDKINNSLKIKTTISSFNTKKNVKKLIINTKGQKICLYGAGLFAQEFIQKYNLSELNIIGIIDKNEEKRGTEINGYKIYSVDDIEQLNPDFIVLTVLEKKHCVSFLEKLKIERKYNFDIIHNLFFR